MWLDPFCRNLELAAQAEHEDDLPENLSEIADLWSSPTRTHVSPGLGRGRDGGGQSGGTGGGSVRSAIAGQGAGWLRGNRSTALHVCVRGLPQLQLTRPLSPQGTFGREPAAVKPDDDRYLRAAIQEYDNIAKLGQIIREGPIKVSPPRSSCTQTPG